jgi:ATP-binding cassette, subfamily C, bacterial
MARNDNARGLAEIMAARAGSNGTLMAVLVFSTFVNLLLLTGPLYMLQVYDRVLGSQSEATLVALSVLVAFLFLAMGFLDHARGRIMARIGARIQDTLDRRVFSASVRRLTVAPGDPAALAAQRDLESIQRLWGSPVLLAIFDIPWTPLFIGAIFIFHPWMGWLRVADCCYAVEPRHDRTALGPGQCRDDAGRPICRKPEGGIRNCDRPWHVR